MGTARTAPRGLICEDLDRVLESGAILLDLPEYRLQLSPSSQTCVVLHVRWMFAGSLQAHASVHLVSYLD